MSNEEKRQLFYKVVQAQKKHFNYANFDPEDIELCNRIYKPDDILESDLNRYMNTPEKVSLFESFIKEDEL